MSKVIPLRRRPARQPEPDAFDRLTSRLVLDAHRRATLNPDIVTALLLAAGLQP